MYELQVRVLDYLHTGMDSVENKEYDVVINLKVLKQKMGNIKPEIFFIV